MGFVNPSRHGVAGQVGHGEFVAAEGFVFQKHLTGESGEEGFHLRHSRHLGGHSMFSIFMDVGVVQLSDQVGIGNLFGHLLHKQPVSIDANIHQPLCVHDAFPADLLTG